MTYIHLVCSVGFCAFKSTRLWIFSPQISRQCDSFLYRFFSACCSSCAHRLTGPFIGAFGAPGNEFTRRPTPHRVRRHFVCVSFATISTLFAGTIADTTRETRLIMSHWMLLPISAWKNLLTCTLLYGKLHLGTILGIFGCYTIPRGTQYPNTSTGERRALWHLSKIRWACFLKLPFKAIRSVTVAPLLLCLPLPVGLVWFLLGVFCHWVSGRPTEKEEGQADKFIWAAIGRLQPESRQSRLQWRAYGVRFQILDAKRCGKWTRLSLHCRGWLSCDSHFFFHQALSNALEMRKLAF